jgi:hypothetical protein
MLQMKKLNCDIPINLEEQPEFAKDLWENGCKGLAQLFEYNLGRHYFWFGLVQIAVNIPTDKPVFCPIYNGTFSIVFEDGRRGAAYMSEWRVEKEYVELKFVGFSKLAVPK